MTPFEHLLKPSFLTALLRLPHGIQKKVQKCLELICADPRHPSLQVKKMQGQDDIWEARVDQGYRLLFTLTGRVVSLLTVGPHGILDKKVKLPQDRRPGVSSQEIEQALDTREAALRSLERPGDEERSAAVAPPPPPPAAPTRTPLPFQPDEEQLRRLGVDASWWPRLTDVTTEEALLELEVPPKVLERVLDLLFPRPLEEIREEPDLVLTGPADVDRFIEGALTEFLLKLDPEQEAVVGRAMRGPTMVKGGPGSGKSTVALYRVRELIRAFPAGERPRILFVTYTNALTNVSSQLLQSLLGELPVGLKVSTVDHLALRIVAGIQGNPRMASSTELEEVLTEVRKSMPAPEKRDLDHFLVRAALDGIRDEYLLEEFTWVIEGRGLSKEEDYLAVDRQGRGYRFDAALRRAVWNLYRSYRDRVKALGWMTWGGLRERALELVRTGEFEERWDHVLIDESQDLDPRALGLLVEICRDPTGLFLTADACQSLYNRGFRFSDVHPSLSFQGRTRLLKKNYRSTAAIGKLARQVLQGKSAGDDEALDQQYVRAGEPPVWIQSASWNAEVDGLVRELRAAALAARLPLSCAGILVPHRHLGHMLAAELRERGLLARFYEGKDIDLKAATIKVMTIHSAKGLEFPLVVLPALEEGTLPRKLEDRKADDLGVHLAGERRLLFVGMTRAMNRLILASTRENPSSFLKDLSPACLRMVEATEVTALPSPAKRKGKRR